MSMANDLQSMLSRADFYDQQWFSSSPYKSWISHFGAKPSAQVKDLIVRNSSDNLLSGGYYDDWLRSFNQGYSLYVNNFNRQQSLANQHQGQMAELAAQSVRQRQQLDQARMATNAAAASLKILSTPSSTAPTAPLTRRKPASPRATGAMSSLRIGQTAAGAGAGINIGG